MKNRLSCNQVISLINFYAEKKLTPKLEKLVEEHIQNCQSCKKKYNEFVSIIAKYKTQNTSIYTQTKEENIINADEEFSKKLSEYIDNELDLEENVKIKKIAISNPDARKKLDTMYKFKQLIQSSYERTKSSSKIDYSKEVIAKIENCSIYTTTCFNKIILIFCILIISIITGFIYLYF